MASSHQESIMQAGRNDGDDGEPVITRERKATANGDSVLVNLTKVGTDIVGVESGEMLQVEVYDDHFKVRTAEE